MVRAVLYDEKGREFKNFSAKEIKKLEGIWTAMLLEMKNIQSGHRTVISIRDIKYNKGLSDDFFTTRELEKTR
jgi:outer membrane lipoprotein-sorting protein